MSRKAYLAAAAMLLGIPPALAHTIVGNRVFPVTLTIDDPGVNDELALPAFAYMATSNPDGTPGALTYALSWEYAKTITPDFALSIGDQFDWQKNPSASGWTNIETQGKYVLYQNAEHEFILATALSVEWVAPEARKAPPSPPIPSRPSRRKPSSAKGSAMRRSIGYGLSQ